MQKDWMSNPKVDRTASFVGTPTHNLIDPPSLYESQHTPNGPVNYAPTNPPTTASLDVGNPQNITRLRDNYEYVAFVSSPSCTSFVDPYLQKTSVPSHSPSPLTQPYWTLPSAFGDSSLTRSGPSPNLQESHKSSNGQSEFPSVDTSNGLPDELQSIALDPVDKQERDSWSEATILDREFRSASGKLELVQIAKYFSVPRSLADLDLFLVALGRRFPPECQWIHPLLVQFEKQRGKQCVVIMMQRPLREKPFSSPSQHPCFTEVFATGFESLGLGVIKLDFRKQCRRNSEDTNCPGIRLGVEQSILGLCTTIELLIITHFFKDGLTAFTRRLATHDEIVQKERNGKKIKEKKNLQETGNPLEQLSASVADLRLVSES
ncbi:uncharacterized protein FIESC28_04221 [Fusarium coffeatum]|uniref:Uncharacterized protein n=1 Tax=Fusarium coffeatum TaxID=231269 RepID=A0A366S0T8_9HYPO|nr:uncharacterized protein FIESC28_04221 [Fusarium coffeatum]RBR22923.1 hypothetical protein FIESC28_04221 [Fusarium coffeatum]